MKYGYKETRKVDMCELRKLCIQKHWFTEGTNEEYDKLLNYAHCENITTDELVEMATLILENSSLDYNYEVTTIMWNINEICYTYFTEV